MVAVADRERHASPDEADGAGMDEVDGARMVGIIGRGRGVQAIAAAARAAGWEVCSGDGGSVAAGGARIVVADAEGDASATEHLLRTLDAATAPDVVLAVDPGHQSVQECARGTRRPERVIGLNHVSFDTASAVVELVVAERSQPWALEVAARSLAALGLRAVTCADAPGRIVDRIGRPYTVEAVRLLEAGHADVAAIDAAFEASGYACGPLRLIDRVGLDVDLDIDVALCAAFHQAPRFRPPALLRSLVAVGRTGRDHGRGFYRYAEDGSSRPDLEIALSDPMPAEGIVERLELAVINEAYRAVEEGVASPQDVDVALRLGLGHPRGPFELVDHLGLRHVVARLHDIHADGQARSGDQYAVAAALWQVATL